MRQLEIELKKREHEHGVLCNDVNALRRESMALGGPRVSEIIPESAELRAKRKSVEGAEARRRQA